LTLMVADSQLRQVKRFDRNLNFIDSFFEYKSGQGVLANVGRPAGIFISRRGDIYISDTDNNRVMVLDGFYNLQTELGGFGFGYGELSGPRGLVTGTTDNLFVADMRNHRISVYNNLGEYQGDFGSDRLRSPVDISIDSHGYLYISDEELHSVMVFSSSGRYMTDSMEHGLAFGEPAGLQFSPSGNLCIADRDRNQILILETMR